MPCLNEAESLGLCISKAQEWLSNSNIEGEIIVADNGSTDNSYEIATQHGARVVNVPIKGYGSALYHGVLASSFDFIIMGDSDDSYDFSKLDPFYDKLMRGFDLVIGNRFLGGIEPGAMPWKNRYIGNPALSLIGRILFKSKIKDFHCGLRGFRKDAFLRMDLRTTGMEFASEMIVKAHLLQMKITDTPTTLSIAGRSRAPHLRPWRDGWRHLRLMLLLSPRWLFLYPGIAFIFAGFVVGGALILGPIIIHGIRFSLGTLIYSAMLIELGFQGVLFSLLIHIFGMHEGLISQSKNIKIFRLDFFFGIGFTILLAGFGLLYQSTSLWASTQFGDLDTEKAVRIIVTSSLTISIGIEIILSSLFLGILRLSAPRNQNN